MPPKPKSNSKILIFIILALTMVIPIGLYFDNKADTGAKKSQLDKCLATAKEAFPDSNTADNYYYFFASQSYDMQLACYEKFKSISPTNEVQEARAALTGLDSLDDCLSSAEVNYAVSQEEIDSVGTDLNTQLVLMKRIGGRIDAQIKCHRQYNKTPRSEAEISKLKAAKTENTSYQEMLENAITNQNASSKNYTSCYSRSSGSTVYTECY